jgi:IclR family transcriptional regulator, acetate operon repressor
MESLRELDAARVSELARHADLPRTTVDRLLRQLEGVSAVSRVGSRWRLGSALALLTAPSHQERQLTWAARRPVLDLATATRETTSLSLDRWGRPEIVDVVPGARRLPFGPTPGLVLDGSDARTEPLELAALAGLQAQGRARRGDLTPVVEAGEAHPALSCVAAPFRTRSGLIGAVETVVAGGHGVHRSLIGTTAQAALAVSRRLG